MRGAYLIEGCSKNYFTAGRVYHSVSVQRSLPLQILSGYCQNEIEVSVPRTQAGCKSLEDYDLEFNRLARFSPIFVSTKELKAEHFIAGLRETLEVMWHLKHPQIIQKPSKCRPSLICLVLTNYS